MKEGQKLRLKKFYFHPITIYFMLIIFTVLISALLSSLEMQATYRVINTKTYELEPTLVAVENMLSFDGIKFMISNAAKNFLSFGPLGSLIISLIGITIAEATGLIEAFSKRYLKKIPKQTLTFIVIFVATVSSLINSPAFIFSLKELNK